MTDPNIQVADQISSVSITEPLPVQVPKDVKQEMTMKLSQQTNMNLQWSLTCLEKLSWNYDNAFSAYEKFKKQGQIPAEAFSKEYKNTNIRILYMKKKNVQMFLLIFRFRLCIFTIYNLLLDQA